MNRRIPSAPIVALIVALFLAGCTGPDEPTPAMERTPDIEIDADRPDPTYGEVVTGPAVGPDLSATLDAPPRLVPGEWWRIRFQSDLFPTAPELVRVVADRTEDGYLVGMPHEGWHKEAIAYHAPAFGDIAADLSYALHNVRFEPLRFPLVQGESWETTFGTSPFLATVERVDGLTATVRFDPPEREPQPTDAIYGAISPVPLDAGMKLVYDAAQHEVVRFESVIGTWEVVAHGYDYTGWVTVPRGLHTAIDYGQFLTIPEEPAFSRTITIEGGFNRLTLMHGVFAFGPGMYRIRDTAPDGTTYTTESSGDQRFTVAFHEASDPDGDWTLEDLVVGPGGTYTMGMAYHQYDIRLPDGVRRTDHSHAVIR
ncbi:MAG: hypothetical protein KY455_02320 [Euryarchaeota archaeon]|nr:hypothetical protein [Euryarchaeota archaeon]